MALLEPQRLKTMTMEKIKEIQCQWYKQCDYTPKSIYLANRGSNKHHIKLIDFSFYMNYNVEKDLT